MIIFTQHCGYRAGIRLYPGSKGGDMPAPDPELVKAQIRSMGYQDTAITQMMEQSGSMLPLQREQMQFGLDSARSAYGQSQEDRDWMLSRRGGLSGMQDTLVQDARDFNSADRSEELVGMARADVNQAFSSAADQQQRGLSRTGVNPSSGKSLALRNQMELGHATALAGASTKMREAARMEGYALTDRASNALAGYPAMGMQATGAGAGFGGMGLQIANQGLAGMNSGYGAAAGAAGQMGQNASSMYGAQGNLYANTQGQDQTGAILGAVGGIGMAI